MGVLLTASGLEVLFCGFSRPFLKRTLNVYRLYLQETAQIAFCSGGAPEQLSFGFVHGSRETGAEQQPAVELSWRTENVHLTMHTTNPTMLESVEWAESVAQKPPAPMPSRSAAAAAAADRLTTMLLSLERGAAPTTATNIEQHLQPLVDQHGDAILVDLIDSIMAEMARRGVDEDR